MVHSAPDVSVAMTFWPGQSSDWSAVNVNKLTCNPLVKEEVDASKPRSPSTQISMLSPGRHHAFIFPLWCHVLLWRHHHTRWSVRPWWKNDTRCIFQVEPSALYRVLVTVALFQHTKATEIDWKKQGSLERAHTHTSAVSQIAKNNGNRRGYGQWRTQEFCSGGVSNKSSWGQRAETKGIWRR